MMTVLKLVTVLLEDLYIQGKNLGPQLQGSASLLILELQLFISTCYLEQFEHFSSRLWCNCVADIIILITAEFPIML